VVGEACGDYTHGFTLVKKKSRKRSASPFPVRGIGYADADVVPLLRMINTAFDPQTLHEPVGAEYKEFDTGRRYPWAHDRVM
jgi:hypothetical protein